LAAQSSSTWRNKDRIGRTGIRESGEIRREEREAGWRVVGGEGGVEG
jgi:hypothetical protein